MKITKISTRKVAPGNPRNDRGKRTWEWDQKDNKQIVFSFRRKGEHFGNHFHKGKDPSKNPERFLLLRGIFEFVFIYKNGKKQKLILSPKKGPIELILPAYVFHKILAKTDCYHIEYRTTYFNSKKPDTYTAEFFPVKIR